MGVIDNILEVFRSSRSSKNARNEFFSENIDALFGYLTSRISNSNQAHTTIVYINNYLKLKNNERQERLAESYLFVEKYLTDIDPKFDLSKEKLRSRIKVQYAPLLSIESFAIIFEEENKQEFELCRLFLREVITEIGRAHV